jgi:hypothetical protein
LYNCFQVEARAETVEKLKDTLHYRIDMQTQTVNTKVNDIVTNTVSTVHYRTLTKGSGIISLDDAQMLLNLLSSIPTNELVISKETEKFVNDLYESSIFYVDNYCDHYMTPTVEQSEVLAIMYKVVKLAS